MKTNLDLARECGGIITPPHELDAFVERIPNAGQPNQKETHD